MRRRKPEPEEENHERWLVSYADFITLMFAFFVVMFASAKADQNRAHRVQESIKRAYEHGQISSIIRSVLGRSESETGAQAVEAAAPRAPASLGDAIAAALMPSLEVLNEELKKEIQGGQVTLRMEARGLVITLSETAFFAPGDDAISPAMIPSIGKIADAILKLPNPVRLEGHTDSIPIKSARFASNWHLSASRSIAMLHLLTDRFGVPLRRLAIAGYAETLPVDTNETAEGRARNRRVDVVIFNEAAVKQEPAAMARNRAAAEPKPPAATPAPRAATDRPAAPSSGHGGQ